MTDGADQGAVVVGIIDDGIAFGHQRFRKVVGGNIESRVEFWWLQDGVHGAPAGPFPFPLPPALALVEWETPAIASARTAAEARICFLMTSFLLVSVLPDAYAIALPRSPKSPRSPNRRAFKTCSVLKSAFPAGGPSSTA